MKVRDDFVTNSSSSSFMLAFNSKEDGIVKIATMTKKYGSDYIAQLLDDFAHATPIPKEDIRNHIYSYVKGEAEGATDFGDGDWWSSDKPSFQKQWLDDHPGMGYRDYYVSDARKAEVEHRIEKKFKEIEKDIGDASYLVELEYEDHTDGGAALEHDILPNQNFTVCRFNLH